MGSGGIRIPDRPQKEPGKQPAFSVLVVLLLVGKLCLQMQREACRLPATSKIRERAVRGSIRIKKVPVETEKAEARYRFWGLPTGVNMLPKFAPIVCKTMVEINSFCCPVIVRIIMPKGTNVSSDTSLVMNMLEKKHSRESTSINCRVVRTFVSSAEPRK